LNSWRGEPILQTPDDIISIQEIISERKPNIILEIGVAWGGLLLMYDSLAKECGIKKIIGIDTFIPTDLKKRLANKIKNTSYKLINSSSLENKTLNIVKKICGKYKKILIHLDSNHTKEHVLKELEMYSVLSSKGDYIIVSDTIIEYIPTQNHRMRDWKKGNNPKNAIDEFLKKNKKFEIDITKNHKQLITNNPGGFLKKVSS
jgi:cephalosporin hydroxylase